MPLANGTGAHPGACGLRSLQLPTSSGTCTVQPRTQRQASATANSGASPSATSTISKAASGDAKMRHNHSNSFASRMPPGTRFQRSFSLPTPSWSLSMGIRNMTSPPMLIRSTRARTLRLPHRHDRTPEAQFIADFDKTGRANQERPPPTPGSKNPINPLIDQRGNNLPRPRAAEPRRAHPHSPPRWTRAIHRIAETLCWMTRTGPRKPTARTPPESATAREDPAISAS